MSRTIVVRDDLGERVYEEGDFPLSLGRGADADLRLPGSGYAGDVAFLGLHDARPFVQPAGSAIPIFCNERLVEQSRWLEAGDTIRIDTVRVRCEISDGRIEFRVADAAPVSSDDPVIVVPPPSLRRTEAEELPAPDTDRLPPALAVRSRGLAAGIGAAVLLFGLLGWFLLSARAVRIDIEPEPDSMSVVGAALALELGGRRLLLPGKYVVQAEKQGYHDLSESIEVGGAASQSFEIRMQRLPGLLSVVTPGAPGARVLAGGVLLGTTPISDTEIEAGSYTLQVESERHLPYSSELSIEGGGHRQALEVELVPAWSEYSVTSEPDGAELRIDGEPVGATPIVAELMQGERLLELALPGFETWRAVRQVRPNQPLHSEEIVLAPADGRLTLRSRPTGASVSVDGRFRGRTPLELSMDPEEPHRVQLFKAGHETLTRSLTLERGELRSLLLSLDAENGELHLVTEPAGARLFVDGAPAGSGTQSLELTAIPHVIELRLEGYETHRSTVTPHPGFPQELVVELATADEVKLEGLPRYITTGAGQALRLVEPGSFEMGAPRREQGRRANEIRRSVELTRPVYVGVKEVSNSELREFRPEHDSGLYRRFSLDGDLQPAVRISWQDAARYCNWLSRKDGLPAAYLEENGRLLLAQPVDTGYRLLTEAEWAWVSRLAGQGESRRYPWGSSLPPTSGSGNYADLSANDTLPNVLRSYRDDFPVSAPIGSFPPSPIGFYDLGGNVAEWVNDYYAVSRRSGEKEADPTGPSEGRHHVVRGSSWQDSSITKLRISFRDYSSERRADLGFRIARYAI